MKSRSGSAIGPPFMRSTSQLSVTCGLRTSARFGASFLPLVSAQRFSCIESTAPPLAAYSSSSALNQSVSTSMSQRWSVRMSFLQCLQVLIRSAKPPRWPDASQTFGFMMMVQSTPTMSTGLPSGPSSSRCTTSCHHAFFRLRLSSVPSGP